MQVPSSKARDACPTKDPYDALKKIFVFDQAPANHGVLGKGSLCRDWPALGRIRSFCHTCVTECLTTCYKFVTQTSVTKHLQALQRGVTIYAISTGMPHACPP